MNIRYILNGSEIAELTIKNSYWDKKRGKYWIPSFLVFLRELECDKITHIEGSDEWIFEKEEMKG